MIFYIEDYINLALAIAGIILAVAEYRKYGWDAFIEEKKDD